MCLLTSIEQRAPASHPRSRRLLVAAAPSTTPPGPAHLQRARVRAAARRRLRQHLPGDACEEVRHGLGSGGQLARALASSL